MDWLNYHHLLYFWMVAREGSIVRAAAQLHLAEPTISAQIARLERSLGAKLFVRAGRNLRLTETGRLVQRYADEIFSLGRELTDAVRGRPTGQPLRLVVGVPDVLPKLIVFRLLQPAFQLPEPVRLVCREGKLEELVAALATHELDVVLSDAPLSPGIPVKAFSHLLGQCGVAFFAAPDLARELDREFPQSLATAPLLLPSEGTTPRRLLDQWFDEQGFRPNIAAEFQDSALLKVFGQEGLGAFPAPAAIVDEIQRQYRVRHVGTLENLHERYYAISVERRLKHPAVVAISSAARERLFTSRD
ncbi:MAG: transcriptional activator NhaR [Pirellulaceae bacterium]|nr:transcriptional activator NhaR [Pirellulaceae bacterium]